MRMDAETGLSWCSSMGTSFPAADVSGRADGLPRSGADCHIEDMAACSHLDSVAVTELPAEVPGCEDCLRAGGVWLHLRICLECGHVGCCDDSPNKHATAHSGESGHPLIRSLEPGETWSWCYADQIAMVIPEVHGSTRIPPSPMLG